MEKNNECFWLVGNNYLNLSKIACRHLGLTTASMLCQLLELEELAFKEIGHEKLISHPKYGHRWFYAKIDTIEYNIGLSKNEQATALKKLIQLGFIENVVFGLPAFRYFRINKMKINEYFNLKISLLDFRKSESGKHNLNNEPQNDEKDAENSQNKLTRFPKIRNLEAENQNVVSTYIIPKEIIPKENTNAPLKSDAHTENSETFFEPNSDPKKQLIKPFPNIEVTTEEHEKLVAKFGEKLVQEGYEELSIWKKSATKKQVDKHQSDYLRLRKWQIPDIQEREVKHERYKQQNVAHHRRNSKLVTPGDVEGYDGFKHKKL